MSAVECLASHKSHGGLSLASVLIGGAWSAATLEKASDVSAVYFC